MIFAGVRLPDQIRIAFEEDKLVIFAGAGVSLPAPSNLPSFNGLVRQICGQPSVQSAKEDQVLGKLARNGTDVHAAAVKILYHSKTHPTELHKQALRIFGSPEKVRIVTTNFDDHFSAAARSVFRKHAVKEFYAPALPQGDDFQGIVYLHGSARENPQAMVLTDKNFGAAYLTRGWVRDFLISLFSEYTVLFVGYSHNDITTTYLARGLNQAQVKPRWTLVSSNLKQEAEEHWAHLEIGVQQYPIDPTNIANAHQALTDFFIGWAKHNRESLLHRSRRMKSIAASLPPESETVSEYLDYCLRHPQLAQDFCNAIRHPAWIGWMNAKGYLKVFFADSTKDLKEHERVIAHWLSTFVRRNHPELLLEIIQAQHQSLCRPFTQIFGHVVWVEETKSPDPNFSTWVSLLLSQGDQALSQDIWAYLLQQCRIPKHAGIALRLFELLTTPQIHLRKYLDFSGMIPSGDRNEPKTTSKKKVDYEIVWPDGSRHWLDEAWKTILKPNLTLLGDSLTLLATKQITLAHLLLREVGKAGEYNDSLSWHRSSIAEHEQNRHTLHECLSVLVDLLRDVLLHWFQVNPARAQAQIQVWWSSKFPLLQRLAIFGISVNPKLTGDERLAWLLDNELVFRLGMKKEVFDVLSVAYPSASEATRKRLLKRIQQGFKGKLKKRVGPETDAYEQFNVLVWLRKSDEKCRLVFAAIAKIKKSYPDFAEREHPAFDHWSGDARFIDPKEGFNVDKILSESPARFVDSLLTASESSTRRDRWGHLSLLETLFGKDKTWAKEFTEALSKRETVTKEIWNAVFSAWKQLAKTRQDWIQILAVADGLPELPEIFGGLSNLLLDIWKAEADIKSEEAIISKAAVLADRAWAICSTVDETPDDSYRDWLTSAINHEGGWIGEFWVHYCSHLRQHAGKKWPGIPPALKSKMKEAIQGTTRLKVYARIAITPWMSYIFVWDKQFATEHFLPLLDWRRDPVVAQQTWSVLLKYRRGAFVEMEEQLLPYYRQVSDRVSTMLNSTPEKTDQFDEDTLHNLGHYLAGLAMRVIENPVKSGFFRDFLSRLPEKVRGSLAQGMGDFLEASPQKAGEVWNLWLREYVDKRLIGVPVALSDEETKAMADWCLYLGAVFPEAVERITQMRLKGVFGYGIIDKLLKSPLLDSFPKESCRYANAVMKGEDHAFLHDQHSQLHSKFRQTIYGSPEFKEFEELLYLRGWKK
jgi:hypothetical protein